MVRYFLNGTKVECVPWHFGQIKVKVRSYWTMLQSITVSGSAINREFPAMLKQPGTCTWIASLHTTTEPSGAVFQLLEDARQFQQTSNISRCAFARGSSMEEFDSFHDPGIGFFYRKCFDIKHPQ